MRDYLVGETITFEADADTDGYLETDHAYSWSIDGSSYAANPKTYAFTAEGAYTSEVTATNTVTGGTAKAQVTVNVVEPANTNWQALAALPPQSIESPIVASLNDGKALIICGTKSWEFDGATWTPVGNLTYPRYGNRYGTPGAYAPRSVTAADGRVWVFGNTNLGDVPNGKTIEIYDPSTKTWSISTYTLPASSLSYGDVLPVYIGGCVYVGISSNTSGVLSRYVVDPTHTALSEGVPSPGGPTGTTGGLSPIVRVTDTKIGVMLGSPFKMWTLDVTASASVNWVGPFNILGAGIPFNLGMSCVPDGIGGVYIVTDGGILHNALDGTASVRLDSEYIGGAYLYYLMHIRKIGNSLFMVGEVPFWNGSSFHSAFGSTFFDLSSNTWSKTRCKKFTTTSPSGVYDKFYTGCGLLNGKPIVVGTYPATGEPWPAVQFLDFEIAPRSIPTTVTEIIPTPGSTVTPGGTVTPGTDFEVLPNTWYPSLACPYQMRSPTYAVLPNGNLFVCGDLGEYDTCWETDGSSWVNRGENPSPRINEGLNKSFIYPALDDGRIIAVGGRNSNSVMSVYTDFYDPSTNRWSAGPATKLNHLLLSNIHKLSDGRVFIIGGHGDPDTSEIARPEFYDPKTDSWSLGAPVPTGDTMWDAGGLCIPVGSDRFLMLFSQSAKCCLYDAVVDAWGTPASFPPGVSGRRRHHGVVVGGKAYTWGMEGGINKAMIYDIASNTCSMAASTFGDSFYGKAYVVNGGIWLDRMQTAEGAKSVFYLPDSDTYVNPALLSGAGPGNPFGGIHYWSATVGGRPFVFGSIDKTSAPYQVATIYSEVI